MKKQVKTDKAPKADHILSQGLVVGDTIYLSGQIHNGPNGVLVEGDTKQKVEQIIQNVKEILEAANAGLNDVIKIVIYVTDIALIPEINETYPTYFSEPFPVREAVCVSALPLGASIEMSVIASLAKS